MICRATVHGRCHSHLVLAQGAPLRPLLVAVAPQIEWASAGHEVAVHLGDMALLYSLAPTRGATLTSIEGTRKLRVGTRQGSSYLLADESIPLFPWGFASSAAEAARSLVQRYSMHIRGDWQLLAVDFDIHAAPICRHFGTTEEFQRHPTESRSDHVVRKEAIGRQRILSDGE